MTLELGAINYLSISDISTTVCPVSFEDSDPEDVKRIVTVSSYMLYGAAFS